MAATLGPEERKSRLRSNDASTEAESGTVRVSCRSVRPLEESLLPWLEPILCCVRRLVCGVRSQGAAPIQLDDVLCEAVLPGLQPRKPTSVPAETPSSLTWISRENLYRGRCFLCSPDSAPGPRAIRSARAQVNSRIADTVPAVRIRAAPPHHCPPFPEMLRCPVRTK